MSDIYEQDGIRVEFEAIGEGLGGDYNPDDPDDVELLRFYVSVKAEHMTDDMEGPDDYGYWTPQDSSYCTHVPVSATPQQRQALLKFIHGKVSSLRKRDMEEASWASLKNLPPELATDLPNAPQGGPQTEGHHV